MNYSDFDKIEQDEWSLTRPTVPTPKGGVLTIVGWSGKKGGKKQYVLQCNLCKKDRDLFGDGVFQSSKNNLEKGAIPCGCGRHFYDLRQYMILVKRKLNHRRDIILGAIEELEDKPGQSTIHLSCINGHSWESTPHKILHQRAFGCRWCGNARAKNKRRLSEHSLIKSFFKTGAYEGFTFKMLGREDYQDPKFACTCPICSEDEYVKAGLCDGIFITSRKVLTKGFKPCRCGGAPVKQAIIISKLKASCKSEGNIFVGLMGEGKTGGKFIYLCPTHGEQVGTVHNNIYGKRQGCPECKGLIQRQSYINEVLDGEVPVAIKFGISKDTFSRLQWQNSRNLFRMSNIGVWEFPSVKSCKVAENQCKKELECRVLTERELKDGWTETTHIKNLDRIIEIYENNGGKRIA